MFTSNCSILEEKKKEENSNVSTTIKSHLEENLKINSQVDGVFSYALSIRINKTKTSVDNAFYATGKAIENDEVYKGLSSCLKSFKSQKNIGKYNIIVNLNLVSSKYSVKIL